MGVVLFDDWDMSAVPGDSYYLRRKLDDFYDFDVLWGYETLVSVVGGVVMILLLLLSMQYTPSVRR